MTENRLKFRVYDIRRKVYFNDPVPPLNSDGTLAFQSSHPDFQKYYITEFCTGLKDKNGNLIYEGDIIHEVDKEADIDDVSQIVWSQYTCHFMKLDLPETGLDRHCLLCEDDSPYIEIIGNIHEQVKQKE